MGLFKTQKITTTDSYRISCGVNTNMFEEDGSEITVSSPPDGGLDCFEIAAKSKKIVSIWLTDEQYATMGRVASGGVSSLVSFGRIMEVSYHTDAFSCIFILHPHDIYHSEVTKDNGLRQACKLTLLNPFDQIAYINRIDITVLIPRR